MFAIALLIGGYSYAILFLGLFHWLSFIPVLLTTFIFVVLVLKNFRLPRIDLDRSEMIIISIIVVLAIVNLIGALGPELAFDALWYHLPIPQLFINNNSVYFIEGNLFYYSLMPKLVEMLYIPALLLANEIPAKLIHYIFGILCCVATYKISRLYLGRKESLLCVLAFYSNLVISWLSITAYSDLARVFFEATGFYYLLLFLKNRTQKTLLASGLIFGLAICTKILSASSLVVVIPIFLKNFWKNKRWGIESYIVFVSVAVALSMPWLIIAYFYTGNPFYPLFTHLGLRNFSLDLLSPYVFLQTFVKALLFADDPISPLYLITLPLIFYKRVILYKKYAPLLMYVVFSALVWYFFTQSGGARFLSLLLPVLTVLCYLSVKELGWEFARRAITATIIIISFATILYRGAANAKYTPVILGHQTRQDFLMANLNFNFGDFYDENSEIRDIVGNDLVLISGVHNLYYVDFNYTLSEWDNAYKAKYILIQGNVPPVYNQLLSIYKNDKTNVTLYKL